MAKAVAFMGGTFDPVHNGHLRTALEIRQLLAVDEIRLIPCHVPVHRNEPGCSSEQRLEMLSVAVENEPGLVVDDRELRSDQASYSINTLESLRQELGPDISLSMVMGMDSFLTLPSWHRWQEYLALAHILVVQRPGWKFSAGNPVADWCQPYLVDDVNSLMDKASGSILMHQLTPLGISATQIRQLIRTNHSPRYLIPDPVWDLISERGLYSMEN